MEVSGPVEQPPSKVKQLFWTVVTVLVWLVLIAGIAVLVGVSINVIEGDSALPMFWPLLITAAAVWALWRGVARPAPEPDPNPSYFAWLGEWGRTHPIRAFIYVYFLLVLGCLVVAGIASLF